MKKLISIFTLPLMAVIFFTCQDVNKHLDGFDDLLAQSKIKNEVQYTYTLVDADYSAIVTALYRNRNHDDSVMARQLNTDRAFSDIVPSTVAIPYLLNTKWVGANEKSSAIITSNFKSNRSDMLVSLSQPSYLLTNADYQLVWGNNYVSSLSPAKAPAAQIPTILKERFPNAKEGDYQIVDYNYSPNEPQENIAEVASFNADFEGLTTSSSTPLTLDGWINQDIKGSLFWQCRVSSNNQYAQVTSNNSNAENEIWLITPQIDLTQIGAPRFSFSVNVGYYNGDCLSIQVSENFDGTVAGIPTATWTDITNNFTIPKAPATGYGVFGTAGTMQFSSYAGKKVYVAFKYSGDGRSNVRTTTCQIDNVKFSEMKTTMTIDGAARQYGAYQFTGGNWQLAGASTVVLQPADYTSMGQTYLTTATAANYLPQWLAQKYPYSQEGNTVTVVYKSGSGNTFYADNYTFTGGKWTPNSTVNTQTEQFVFAGWDHGGWMFDPTVYYTMVKDDYQMMCDYVLNNPELSVFKRGIYTTEEWYFGFSAYYSNVNLRLSGSLTSSRAVECSVQNDTELYSLTTPQEQIDLLWNRLETKGMIIFLQLRFPNAVAEVNGIPVDYNITANIYCPDGTTASGTKPYVFTYHTLTSGTATAPPTFEFVSANPK